MLAVQGVGMHSGHSLRKYMALSMPSLWVMFVYSEDTSIDASRQLSGNVVFSISFMNSVESLMCDGSLHMVVAIYL